MRTITISAIPGFDEWRDAAKKCIYASIHPDSIIWQTGDTPQTDLFASSGDQKAPENNGNITVPKSFAEMAQVVICHNNPAKYDRLYRMLWRIKFEDRYALSKPTNNNVMALNTMRKNVRRDAYKITAFLRFREIEYDGLAQFIAWYEPEHYTLERVLPFFKTRFKNMNWSILTPYRAAHWNMEEGAITLQDNPDPSLFPKDDKVEGYWLTYYASIFNPARPKKQAMLSQMPKKYWKNMPETKLIGELLKSAETRTKNMIINK